jgi:cytochrome c-type biogenesis protein CcmH
MEPNSAPLDKLKQQLAQLDRLVAEGVLTGAAARRSRDDLESQVLAAVLGKAPVATAGGDAVPVVRPPRRLLAGVGLFVLAFGLAGYAWQGNRAGWAVGPGEPGAAAAAANEEAAAPPHAIGNAEIEAMIAKLAERLKAQPDDANGWSMLARSYTAQGKYKEALAGYKRVVELRPKDAQALADYADGLAVLNNRSLEGEPEKLIMQAVKLDPANVKALALAGTIAFNKAEYKAAADYWGRAMQGSEPGSEFAKQLQGALDEARQRAGLAPAPAPLLADAAPGEAAPADAGDPKAAITGHVTLADAVKSKVAPDDTVFIYARAPTGSRMPLAILRKKVSDLPLDFRLDDSLAMSPAARLSGAAQVVVGVRVSKTGNAMAQPGDLESLSAPMAVGASGLRIEVGANPR